MNVSQWRSPIEDLIKVQRLLLSASEQPDEGYIVYDKIPIVHTNDLSCEQIGDMSWGHLIYLESILLQHDRDYS
jgi:hypothetical protein